MPVSRSLFGKNRTVSGAVMIGNSLLNTKKTPHPQAPYNPNIPEIDIFEKLCQDYLARIIRELPDYPGLCNFLTGHC